jgi:hypothetical protein
VDEQLKAKLIGYLDSVESKLKTGADFVADETPKLVDEWLRWLAVEHAIYAGCFLAASLTAILLCRWGAKKLRTECDKYTEYSNGYAWLCGQWSATLIVIGWVSVFLFNIGTIHHAMHTAKVLTAPRVVVVEKIAELTGLSKDKR